jgi:hypothetical protein
MVCLKARTKAKVHAACAANIVGSMALLWLVAALLAVFRLVSESGEVLAG